MNLKETTKIIAVIRATYPISFKDQTRAEAETMVRVWNDMFSDTEYSQVNIALKEYIMTNTSGFPPTIGQLNNIIHSRFSMSESMTAQAASALLAKAVSRSGWHSQEEFEKLPPAIQRVVHDPEMLKQWSQMDSQTFNSVVISNFQRSYSAEVEREKQYSMLPESVKQSLPDFSSVVRKLEG